MNDAVIAPSILAPPMVSVVAVEAAAKLLRENKTPVLFLGGYGLRERGLKAAARIHAKTGCKLICETSPTRMERSPNLPTIARLPYFPEPGLDLLAPHDSFVLAGARNPVTFFGYPDIRSYFIDPELETKILATPEEDIAAALEALADALDAPANLIQQISQDLKNRLGN